MSLLRGDLKRACVDNHARETRTRILSLAWFITNSFYLIYVNSPREKGAEYFCVWRERLFVWMFGCLGRVLDVWGE